MACGKGVPSSHRACVARIGMERRNDAREAMAAAVDRLVLHPGRIRAVPCDHHRRRLAESWRVMWAPASKPPAVVVARFDHL